MNEKGRFIGTSRQLELHAEHLTDLAARVTALEAAQKADLVREPARGMTVRRLRELLAPFPGDTLVAATYDDGCAGGSILRVGFGRDPDTGAPAALLEIG